MKRRRNSAANGGKGKEKVSHLEINYSGPSFSDLPNSILVTILLRLSIKRIFICKCVCKAWYDLISDPDFAKLHFNQARVCHLLRTSGFTLQSRMLYLVEPDDFDICYDSSPIKFKLDTKMKLPLCNIQMILDKEGVESTNSIKLRMKEHMYRIVNSCNGLLCVSNPSDNWPVIVCNPITCEFINLPESSMVYNTPKRPFASSGFGFSPATNQYKVIRMFLCNNVRVVEVHVLGSETWRSIPLLPHSTSLSFPTYLDGCVYWFVQLCSVISFDIENECFESILGPPPMWPYRMESMEVLEGVLYISTPQNCDLHIWAMKDSGASKSWSQVFSFRAADDNNGILSYGSCQPIKYLNNGAILMFLPNEDAFIYKDPRKTGYRYLKIRGFRSQIQAIAHIPSFVPLKHALSLDSGHNLKVFNVKSRCAGLKLNREAQGISIVENLNPIMRSIMIQAPNDFEPDPDLDPV